MMNLAIETTERIALDAARAEGRAEAAEEIQKLVVVWLSKFAEHVGAELDDVGRTRFAQFSAALSETLATKVEEYRREQSRAIDTYVADRRALSFAEELRGVQT